jgi:hypothetical protein
MRRKFIIVVLICGCSRAPELPHRENVPIAQVPPNIMKVAQKQFPDIKFDTVWKTEGGVYEVRGKAKTGKVREVEVSEKGELVQVE